MEQTHDLMYHEARDVRDLYELQRLERGNAVARGIFYATLVAATVIAGTYFTRDEAPATPAVARQPIPPTH